MSALSGSFVALCALFVSGCQSTPAPIQKPIPQPNKMSATIIRRAPALVFENHDIGPLYYWIDSTQTLELPQWQRYAGGVAMPGTTAVPVSLTNQQGFFRVGWPMK